MKAVRGGGFAARELVIRIIAAETEWSTDDLAAVASAGPSAILIPKISSAEDVVRAGGAPSSNGAPATVGLWAMIEIPRAVAGCPPNRRGRTTRATFVMSCCRIERPRQGHTRGDYAGTFADVVLPLRSPRVSGIDAIDGVYNAFRDLEGFTAECRQARDFGFDGKSLIHPDQVDVANAAFSPDGEQIARATAIITAFELPLNRRSGAIVVNGEMSNCFTGPWPIGQLRLAARVQLQDSNDCQ